MKMHNLVSLSVLVGLQLLQRAVCAQAFSDTARTDFSVTDGPVWAMVVTNNTLYVGGEFSYVGPHTGAGVPVDATTGVSSRIYPRVNGAVLAVVADGLGGWFIGGDFSTVGGIPRARLAHLLSSGQLDTQWQATANTNVTKMVLAQGTLYVAGDFTSLSGNNRNHLGALDATTGDVLDWDPNPDGNVGGLAFLDSTIYFGGDFTHVGDTERITLAAVDATTGALKSWPNLQGFPADGFQAIAASDGRVFVSATFPSMIEYSSDFIAFDASTGQKVWQHGSDLGANSWHTRLIRVHSGELYISGGNGIASVSPLDGTILWSQGTVGPLNDIAVIDEKLYVGGNLVRFVSSNTVRPQLACLNSQTGEVLEWNPLANGMVTALAAYDKTIYVGGYFNSVGGVPRINLAAFDVSSGKPTELNVPVDGAIRALAIHDQNLVLGGDIYSVDGQPRRGLAQIELTTGKVLDWAPSIHGTVFSGLVNAFSAIDSTLIVGGAFTNANGSAHSNLVAIDLTDGTSLPWQLDADGPVFKLARAGNAVIAGGAFSNIAGQGRSRLAALDLQTGSLTDWNPVVSSNVTGIAISDSTVYIAGPFDTVGSESRNNLAAISLATGDLLPWAPTAISTNVDGYATSTPLLVRDGPVYFGNRGNFLRNPPVPRALHVFDAFSGLPGPKQPQVNGLIYCFSSDSQRLFVGGLVDDDEFAPFAGVLAFDQPGFSRLEAFRTANGELNLRLLGEEGAIFEFDQGSLNNDWSLVGERSVLGGSANIELPVNPSGNQFFRARLKQ